MKAASSRGGVAFVLVPGFYVMMYLSKDNKTIKDKKKFSLRSLQINGPVMIDWLRLLDENRTACILLDNGTFSRNFKLDSGRAQGDNISPNTFNFADQILILIIELDPILTEFEKSLIFHHHSPLTLTRFSCTSPWRDQQD
jgi:hypothetical protein